jgi:hypothetical protein
VRVNAKQRLRPRCDFGVIQEYERLDQLANIRRADEPSDRTVLASARAKYDSASTGIYGSID